VRCPRCHLETSDPAPPFCPGCGAPLSLADEPTARPLDVPLALDRRTDRVEPPPSRPRPPPAPPGAGRAAAVASRAPAEPARAELAAAADRSRWDLGEPLAVAPADPEPLPGPPAPALAAPGHAPPDARHAPPSRVAAARRDDLPEPDVDVLEIRLRRPETWRRAAAAAIDVGPFVLGGAALAASLLPGAGPGAPATGVDGLLDLLARERVIVLSLAAALTVAVAVYGTLAHALAGATLGKRLLGLAVVGPDGRPPSLGRAAARAGLAVLSAALLGLGLLLALFTRSGRALHDFAARTWVVDAAAPPAPRS
jgi:uncharacterized RDD family membrane protein YckC